MPVNQKFLVGFSREQRRVICAHVEAAYAKHVATCAAYGTDDEDRPIVPADSWEHFSAEVIAVLRAELIEAPPQPDLAQIRHGRRDYSETYGSPRDVSLL